MFLLTLIPFLALAAFTIGIIVAILHSPSLRGLFGFLVFFLAILCWFYTKLPTSVRKLIYYLVQRKRKKDRSGR